MSQTKFIQTTSTVKKGRLDFLSSLQEDVRLKILECLPLEEAVRTSILSTHWRYEWSKIPHIILDRDFFKSVVENKGEESDIMTTYVNIVNNVLICHVYPLRKIVLYIPRNLENVESNIYQWLRFVSGKNVAELTLIDGGFDPRTLPSTVFFNQGLTRLTLCKFIIQTLQPSFTGFPSLITLELSWCQIGSTNLLESLIISCPHLRLLELNYIKLGYQTPDPKALDFMDFESFLTKLLSNNIIPITRELQVRLHFSTEMYVSLIFSSLPVLQCLRLGFLFLMRLNQARCEDIIDKYGQWETKALELVAVTLDCPFHNYAVLKLLNTNSQSLQRLYFICSEIDWCRAGKHTHDSSCNIPSIEDGNLSSLKYVEMVEITGTSNELQLIKNILKCAPLLEVMTIKLSRTVTEAEDKLKISIKCMQYSRASTNAQIIFKP